MPVTVATSNTAASIGARQSSNDILDDKLADKYKAYAKTPRAIHSGLAARNDDPNKGFLLLLNYVAFDRNSNTFHFAINAGHAVTLVNAMPDLILIHDPAHYNDEPGRKILTPELLTGGTFELPGYPAPVAGLLLLSGTLMYEPPDAGILLTGAVCVHHASGQREFDRHCFRRCNSRLYHRRQIESAAAPSTPSTPAAAAPSQSWAAWLFNLIFSK